MSDINIDISRVFSSLRVSRGNNSSLDINIGGFVSGALLETLP